MSMKKTILLFFTTTGLLFAQGAENPYVAYVDALYDIGVGERSILTIGDEMFEVFGADIRTERMSIQDAARGYYNAYNTLSAILDGTKLNKTIRAYTLAKWAEVMTAILYDGLATQQSLDIEFANVLQSNVDANQEELNNAQAEYDERIRKTEETAASISSGTTAVAASLKAAKADMAVLATETKNDLEKVNSRISELASQSWLNDEEREELKNLKNQAQQLSVVEAAARKASTATQMVAAKLSSLDVKVSHLATLGSSTNNWKAVSAWLGQKDMGERKNRGVFLEPQKVETGDGEGNYDHKKGDTIFTMLNDLGIVPVVNDKQREAWKELGGREPDRYLYMSETTRGESDACFARPIGGFPAPSNWVDGETIICSNGVYVASGSDSSYGNAVRTIQAFLNNANANGISGVGSDSQIGDDSLWSTNNPQNPANANFDREDRTNPWNLITYTGDSQVSPKDYRHLYSISFLGEYSAAFGNAFSLYGFYNAPDGAVPYVSRDEAESTLLWKKELEADGGEKLGLGASRTKTLEVIKRGDDDSENVDADMPRYLSLYGFSSAKDGQVPYKKSETELGWQDASGGAALTLVGTDESSATVGSGAATNTVTFASASDSNVKVKVTGGGSSVKVEIGVYWR